MKGKQKNNLYIWLISIVLLISACVATYFIFFYKGAIITANPVTGFSGLEYDNITIKLTEKDTERGSIVLDDSHERFIIDSEDNYYIETITINGMTEDVSDDRSMIKIRYLDNNDLTLDDDITISATFKYGHADTGEGFFDKYPWVIWIGGGLVALAVGFGVLWLLSGKEDKKKVEALKEENKSSVEKKTKTKKEPVKKIVQKKEVKAKTKKEDK